MAKRIQFRAHGGPEVLEFVDYTPAEPGPQQVRVRNQAIGLNFIDTYYRSGLYPLPELPSGLGNEGAGVVDAIGSDVHNMHRGGGSIARIVSVKRASEAAIRTRTARRPPGVALSPTGRCSITRPLSRR